MYSTSSSWKKSFKLKSEVKYKKNIDIDYALKIFKLIGRQGGRKTKTIVFFEGFQGFFEESENFKSWRKLKRNLTSF